jgi:hypothetical protein
MNANQRQFEEVDFQAAPKPHDNVASFPPH